MLGRNTWCGLAIAGLLGCAGAPPQSPGPDWPSRLEELSKTQARLEMRIDEVSRNLLSLRERLDAQESALAAAKAARVEAPASAPPLRVVKLEPGAPEPAEPGGREPSPAADLYRRAFNAFRAGKYGPAILDFEEFLRRNPEHEYADNAQYWIGESYFTQGQFEQAVVEYERLLSRYPQKSRVPDALLKIALSYEKMGDPKRGRAFLDRLVAEYPETEPAREARKLLSVAP